MGRSGNPSAKRILEAFSSCWPAMAAELTASGQRWSDVAIELDCAYLADRANHPAGAQPIPSRGQLGARWGMTASSARRRMVRFLSSPNGQQADRSRTGAGQEPDRSTPDQAQQSFPTRTGAGQEPDSKRTATGHTRVVDLSPAPAPAPAVDTVRDVWREFHPQSWRRGPPKAWGVQARIAEHGADDVVLVIRWAHTSNHRRARFLREKAMLGKTLFRPANFEEYLGFAHDDQARQRRQGSQRPAPAPKAEDLVWYPRLHAQDSEKANAILAASETPDELERRCRAELELSKEDT